MTARQIAAPRAPIDSHRQAQMHCLANIYVGRAPLGWRTELEIDASSCIPCSIPSPPPLSVMPVAGGWQEQLWGCFLPCAEVEKQRVFQIQRAQLQQDPVT